MKKTIFLCFLLVIFIPACNINNSQTTSKKDTKRSVILTTDEVSKHALPDNCWIIIGNNVYGVTNFLNEHPGGSFRITPFCGKDATDAFATQGGRGSHSAEAYKLLPSLLIGALGSTVDLPN
jgi:cytochrome b involved in lipid metabolism